MRIAYLIVVLVALNVLSVFGQKRKHNDEPVKEFKEDIASFRIHFSKDEEKKQVDPVKSNETLGLPKNDITVFLKEKLDSVYSYNKGICCADGFRIIVYNGTSSEEARNQRNNVYDVLPNEKSYTEWKSPNFKVKVGDYIDKLEAYYAYAKLVRSFPNAIVVPDKINIVRNK